MIVCLCHRVSDRDIRRSVESGVRNFDLLQDETRVASACACCLDCAREVFDEALMKAGCAGRCGGACATSCGKTCAGAAAAVLVPVQAVAADALRA
ncbi:bacterioferritin-associated ferredoxin [Paucibacter oligotrophus]|uniref:Bacterioferritin-associated ferredoxin n=1 Tax=Roseateles oligotrophus TaxID=1769250 RepID=A0A840L687_9BURK|nr:(2Fe-2S)-binding protein [Roseateles oligotrophus]MBB4842323.1 bacterioferritin-associated ferredoxin [Roseateles oligotrophus]